MAEKRLHKLCCYLYKEIYQDIENVLLKEKMFKEEQYKQISTIGDIPKERIIGYLKKNNKNKPAWLDNIRELFDIEEIENISNSLIFFVKTQNRVFAFTNGYANSVVDYTKIEWDFGVKVALNALAGNEIRGLDTRKISLSTHQRREISSSGSTLYEYDFDFDEEFIDSITGRSRDEDFGSSVTGRESLHVNVNMNLMDIEDYCKNLLTVYNKKDYIDKFPFFDKLRINKDEQVYSKFNEQIIEAIKENKKDRIQFLYPNIDEFGAFNYRFIYEKKYKDYNDISLDNILDFIKDKKIKLEELCLKKFSVKISHDEYNKTYSLLDYLVFEFADSEKKYIHTKNLILEIDNDFYSSIKAEIDQCEVSNIDGLKLPPIHYSDCADSSGRMSKKLEAEGEYNSRVVEQNQEELVNLDKNNFRNFPDRSKDQIEICDIITKNKKFICNKIYKHSSAPLSHLFMQGLVSANMLYEVKDYRIKINESVKSKFGDNFIEEDNINRSEITFVYGIGIESDGRIAETLPFFSKISLRQNIKALKKLAYNIEIIRIPLKKMIPNTRFSADIAVKPYCRLSGSYTDAPLERLEEKIKNGF
ncbi:DUF6119 family protein [Treponema denticola]|uniref:TIGR04141 family sporadically distributed protein n=1 Tax=Treponema denticola OTK TaxID=999434 RepID=A0A0F6MPH8_TREDN|nr:DUF6119 family protein [Treponema denticola]EMB21671.1 hypothetical protein HMPREF9723_01444 [Treponema denticola OTK]EMB25360.1 hypothetical protein HMPREF9724_00980 [Treponema denticola SP37]EPF34265.1 TIGR04141 family sporadically distributed protein [Treponema denticola SP44]EPF39074.1 TIGR04141 family sporadically distributed protein [Treponema denticola SP23]